MMTGSTRAKLTAAVPAADRARLRDIPCFFAPASSARLFGLLLSRP